MFANYNNQREDNISPPKLSRNWKTNVRFALHKKLSTPAVLLNDFRRDWPLPPGQEQKNCPAFWGKTYGVGMLIVAAG